MRLTWREAFDDKPVDDSLRLALIP